MLSGFAAIVLLCTTVAAGEFEVAVRAAAVPQSKAAALLRAGDREGATAMLVAWAEREDTAAGWFAVGNTLYVHEPEVALAAHREALRRAPDEPYIHLELALDLHRLGDCAASVTEWEAGIAVVEPRAVFHAIRAHCLLQLDRPDEALQAFRQADLARGHVQLESLFEEMYRPFDPWNVRARLLREARGGRVDAWWELAQHDVRFRYDLWNVKVEPAALEADLPDILAGLSGDPRLEDVRTFVDHAVGRLDDAAAASAYTQRWPSTLPSDFRLAEAVLVARIGAGVPLSELRSVYGLHLRARFETGDAGALRLLSALGPPGDSVAAMDADGCKRFGLPTFCLGRAMWSGNGEPEFDALLKRVPLRHPRRSAVALLLEIERGAPTQSSLRAFLIDAPRLMASADAWRHAWSLLELVRAGKPVVGTVAAELVRAALSFEVSRPMVDCAPWDLEEWRTSPICAVSPSSH